MLKKTLKDLKNEYATVADDGLVGDVMGWIDTLPISQIINS